MPMNYADSAAGAIIKGWQSTLKNHWNADPFAGRINTVLNATLSPIQLPVIAMITYGDIEKHENCHTIPNLDRYFLKFFDGYQIR